MPRHLVAEVGAGAATLTGVPPGNADGIVPPATATATATATAAPAPAPADPATPHTARRLPCRVAAHCAHGH